MNQLKDIGVADKKDHRGVAFSEIRKRLYFIIKLSLLLGLLYANQALGDLLRGQSGLFANVLRAVTFFLTTHLLVSLVRIVIVYFYILRKNLKEREEDNVVLAINRMATIVSFITFIAAIFLLFEIKWETFFTSFSLVAVASVILTKDYISNAINGMLFMISDRFVLGEYIKIGSHEGRVVNITLSGVYLRTEGGELVTVPNNIVYASDVVNLSRKEDGIISIIFELKPEQLKDLTALKDKLVVALQEYKREIEAGSCELLILAILSDKTRVNFQFKLIKPDPQRERIVRYGALSKVSEVTAMFT